jgi:hypothetical protein
MRRILLGAAAVLLAAGVARGDDLLGESTAADAALEDRLRLVLVHALDEDWPALQADVADLAARDDARADDGLVRTGLTDNVRYLAAAVLRARDARRDALDDVLDEHPDPVVRRLAEHHLEADDAALAAQLLADDRHNRRAAVLNDAVRPLGVFSGAAFLAALNPFLLAGSAVDSVVTTAVNLWQYNRLSTPEREALARYRTLLDRAPRTQDAPEIARAIRRLGAKRAEAQCRETVQLAEKMLEADDLDHAAYYVHVAAELEGCAERSAEPREDLTDALAAHDRREDAGRWPVDDPPRPQSIEELRDHEALVAATALGDPGAMVEAARRFEAHHADSHLLPATRYALAVARDLAGHHEPARDALQDLADDDSSAGRHAAALLASPDFNRMDGLYEAERQHARATARYILLGPRLDGRTALYSAAHAGAAGVEAAQSLGILNVIGVATRAWQAWRRDPVSNQAIIERGEELLARGPEPAEAAEVHDRLADAYERSGNFGRALMHYRATPDPSPKRIAKLEGKLADELLATAERDGGNPVLLQGIVQHFAATKAADRARERLRARGDGGEATLSRDVLLAAPALLAPDALDLDPRLLDGERDNGELADGGVTLTPGQLELKLENTDGPGEHVETRALSVDAYARARAATQEVLYARLLTADRRDPDAGSLERYVPVFVQGTLDADGVAVYPGLKMRRYESEDRKLYE